ncbi:MAG: aminotransferase class I/II-fold pyridoxal phosphate-dependent enzyme, partial [Spirochaetales bacterium]|nr:aminotransferase class I/II-fold pyridoxal phosphate-dependent enzyme [Spirochaetales bacterium]
MYGSIRSELNEKLAAIRSEGLYKDERVLSGPQGSLIRVSDGKEVLNFCANNYLGLANNAEIRGAAIRAMETWGYGLASVRFICGTKEPHKELERRAAEFLGMRSEER